MGVRLDHALADSSSTAESKDAEDVAARGSRKHRLAVSAGGSRNRQDAVAASGSRKRRQAISGGGAGNRQDIVVAARSRKHQDAVAAAGTRKKFKASAYLETMKVPVAAIDLCLDVRRHIEGQIKVGQGIVEPSTEKLLPDQHPDDQHVFTVVLDLDDTLVHSDWKGARGWMTFKRPGVNAFLEHITRYYEVVVYSDQLNMNLDTIMGRLDANGSVRYRLSRAATKYENGKHYRDLSKLNRNLAQVIYISGHALESCLQPENCLPIKPWSLETEDTVLIDLIPFLNYVAMSNVSDIRPVLASFQDLDIPTEFHDL